MSIHVNALLITLVLFLFVFINITEMAAITEGLASRLQMLAQHLRKIGTKEDLVNNILGRVKGAHVRPTLLCKQSSEAPWLHLGKDESRQEIVTVT